MLSLWVAVSVKADLSWNIQVVDKATGVGSGFCPIVMDANNIPHIAYSGAPRIRYASLDGPAWSIQQFDYGGYAHDLVLGANGTPCITSGFESLVYGQWNGSCWENQTVTTDHTVYSSLALDSSGKPHIAYVSGDEVKYASQNDSGWSIQTVDKMPEINSVVSLALDSNDTPYIMYSNPTSYVDNQGIARSSVIIKLATLKNSHWNIESVLASSNFDEFGNMVLDSKGYPHFLAMEGHFISTTNTTYLSTILHASWNGSAWNTQKVISTDRLGNVGFLALSSNDYPHVVYNTGEIMYARWTGTAWENYTVDSEGIVSFKPAFSIAIDPKGTPHISYLKNPPHTVSALSPINLMYATANLTETPPTTSPTQATATHNAIEPQENSFINYFLLIISIVIIIAVVITVIAYIRRKNP